MKGLRKFSVILKIFGLIYSNLTTNYMQSIKLCINNKKYIFMCISLSIEYIVLAQPGHAHFHFLVSRF